MEKITVENETHQVKQLVLASITDRALASVIDISILTAVALGLYEFLKVYAFSNEEEYSIFWYTLPLFLVYSLLFESFNQGRSLGKYFLKIRVLKEDGSVGHFLDYATRWCFRFLDVYLSLGIFAMILVSVTEKNQRLGDLIASTIVIKED
jgi:uncharacterized RDD family membrane protein YckC